MGEKVLVKDILDDATALIRKLDDTPTPVSFAAWYYYVDSDEWRLLIASKELDPLLPKEEALAYRKVIDVLFALPSPSLSVSDLKIVSTTYPLLKALNFLMKTDSRGIARAHMSDEMINGIFIKEVVILRSA